MAIAKHERIYFLDHLRTFMIFLVVLLHSGLVYETSGVAGFFWIAYDFSTTPLADLFNGIIDIFVMSIIFFVSGYVAQPSLAKKGPGKFVQSKVRRLILPWALAMITLIPLNKVIFLATRQMPQEGWINYLHFNNGIFSQSWLWYLPVLFFINAGHALLSMLPLRRIRISMPMAVTAAGVLAFAFSMIMDLMHWQGWTKNGVINFQNERLFIYILIYALGILSSQRQLFAKPIQGRGKWVWLLIITLPVYLGLCAPGKVLYHPVLHAGLKWLTFTVSLTIIVYGLLALFQYRWNRPMPLGSRLARASYGVYVIHTVVLGLTAWPMLSLEWPAVVKFVILTSVTYGASNGLVVAYLAVKDRVKSLGNAA